MGQKIYTLAIPRLLVKRRPDPLQGKFVMSSFGQTCSSQTLFRGQETIGKGAWRNDGDAARRVLKKKPVARNETTLGMAGE